MSENTSAKYQPHIMVDIVDPAQDGLSSTWKSCFRMLLFIEVVHFFTFVWVARHSFSIPEGMGNISTIGEFTPSMLLKSIVWHNVFRMVFVIISMVSLAWIWYTFAGDPKKLDYTIEHTGFRIRLLKGLESFSKYGTGTNPLNRGIFRRLIYYILKKMNFFASVRDVITSFTGITHFERETGLTTEIMNEDTWAFTHPYKGTSGFNLFGTPNFIDSDEVIIANFLEAVSTLGPNHLVSTTVISGHNTSYIMDDIEEQLKLPTLSPIREKALWSIYNKFKNRVGTEQPVFIIHIGLPPAVHGYEHVENMRKVRDEFELTLNEIGIETVLIKDPEDLAYIINGLLLGDLELGKDLNEY